MFSTNPFTSTPPPFPVSGTPQHQVFFASLCEVYLLFLKWKVFFSLKSIFLTSSFWTQFIVGSSEGAGIKSVLSSHSPSLSFPPTSFSSFVRLVSVTMTTTRISTVPLQKVFNHLMVSLSRTLVISTPSSVLPPPSSPPPPLPPSKNVNVKEGTNEGGRGC